MPKLLINLLKQDIFYLVISGLIFPLSLKIAIFCFSCFLVRRILFFDLSKSIDKQDRLTQWSKILLAIAIAIAMGDFYLESRSQFYPVSYYDYLLVVITALIVKLYPLNKPEVQQISLAISLSPIVVFISHFTDANFQFRNNLGFNNSNGLGLYCSICFPLILCQLIARFYGLDVKSKAKISIDNFWLILSIISLFLCSTMLVASGSRSSLYTSLLMVLVIFLLNYDQTSKASIKVNLYQLKNQFLLLLLLYFIGFLGFLVFLYELVFTKFVFLGRFLNLTNSTNLYRTYIYQCYWELGWKKPWWGWGIDKTAALCEQKLKARYGGVNHAHNFILQLFADHGLIIALLCLTSIVCWLLIPTIKFIVNYSFSFDSTLILGVYLSSSSILITSLFQSSFYHYPLFPLWLGLFWGIQLSFPKVVPV